MALLNSSTKSKNLLIKRYTLQIENLTCDEKSYDFEWEFRDTLLKCLYSREFEHSWSS